MKRMLLASTLACLAVLPVTNAARAAERATVNRRTGLLEPPVAALRRAAERGDRAELARVAERLGPARLAKALADPDRRTVLAALDGIALAPAGVLLFDQIAPLVGSPEPTLRERAIRTLATLLAGGDAERLDEWEVPAESTRAACHRLALVAASENEQAGLRLVALQGLADAGVTCASSFAPSKLLSSRDPEVRRAAVIALPSSPDSRTQLLATTKDADLRVAAAAAARLCTLVGKSSAPLPPIGLSRLALAASTAVEDLIEMLPCLASSKDPEDAKALVTLATSGPPSVREAVKNLTSKGKGENERIQ